MASVSISDMADQQMDALQRLLQSGMPALLEVGAALKSAQTWEVEAGLVYDELAWFLYDELWDVAAATRPEVSPYERRDQIDLLLDPLIDPALPDRDRASLLVTVFLAVLAARSAPLLDGHPRDSRPITR